jgi:hypothetical protein
MQSVREKESWVRRFLSWEDWSKFLLMTGLFLAAYFIPFQSPRTSGAIIEAFLMLQEYAREHVLFCLVPAFLIAGAIGSCCVPGCSDQVFRPGC